MHTRHLKYADQVRTGSDQSLLPSDGNLRQLRLSSNAAGLRDTTGLGSNAAGLRHAARLRHLTADGHLVKKNVLIKGT